MFHTTRLRKRQLLCSNWQGSEPRLMVLAGTAKFAWVLEENVNAALALEKDPTALTDGTLGPVHTDSKVIMTRRTG
jgi:hypothetical protein